MASQTVKTHFAVRLRTCAQAMRACLIRLRDRGHSHPATGGAGLSAAGIDAGAVAKSTANVGSLYGNGACTSTYAAGGEGRHYAKGVSSFAFAEPTGDRCRFYCNYFASRRSSPHRRSLGWHSFCRHVVSPCELAQRCQPLVEVRRLKHLPLCFKTLR